MLRLIEFLASMSTALFAGAALYINVVEHPARMVLDTSSAALQWAPSYERATWMQAPLALVGLVAGLTCWWRGAGAGWFLGAGLIGAVVPFTFLCIMPTNHRLLEPGRDLGAPATRALLEKWARLHAVRTVLSMAASGIFLWLSLGS